jgi:hypothetical protein
LLQYPDWVFWAALPALMVHQFEEHIIPGGLREWMNRAVFQSGRADKPLSKRAVFILNVPVMWTLLLVTAYVGNDHLWISLPVMSLLFVNAWFHIVTSLAMNTYSPGTYSSIIILLPLTTYTYSYMLSTWQTDFSLIMTSIMFALICHMFILAVPRGWMKKELTEEQQET